MKRLVWKLLFSLFLLGAAYGAYRYWIGLGTAKHTVVYLYSQASAAYLDGDAVVSSLRRNGMDAAAVQTDDVIGEGIRAIRSGASVLILNEAQPLEGTLLLETAERNGTELLFVGAYPGSDFLMQYDKAYYIGSRTAYAGELLGRQVAAEYRSGGLPDQNQDLILEYLNSDTSGTQASAIYTNLLAECEHYGVYTQSAVSAVSEDGTAADAESVDAASVPAEQQISFTDAWANLAYQPEVIFCLSYDDFITSRGYAQTAGWLDAAVPVAFGGYAMSGLQAAQMYQAGCNVVAYYDVDTVSNVVLQMIMNLAHQDYIAKDTRLSPDENHALWIPSQLYTAP